MAYDYLATGGSLACQLAVAVITLHCTQWPSLIRLATLSNADNW